MVVLIIGGSGSGKSSYAEELVISLSEAENASSVENVENNENSKNSKNRENSKKNMKKYYLATMQVFDEEGQKKVDKHRKLRSGKGFLTIEQPCAIQKAIPKMDTGEKAVLLECISNLTANEMFSGGQPQAEERVVGNIIRGVARLKEEVTHLVIVSNNVFEDGIVYDETTMAYIRAMGKINRELAAMADKVVEIVVGIPVVVKG